MHRGQQYMIVSKDALKGVQTETDRCGNVGCSITTTLRHERYERHRQAHANRVTVLNPVQLCSRGEDGPRERHNNGKLHESKASQ